MKLKYNLKNKDNQTLLNACCYFKKERIKVSTGLKVFTETWNTKMQRCEISNKFSDRVNRAGKKINRFLDSVDKEWKKYIELDDPCTKQGYYGSKDYVKYRLGYIIERLHKSEEEKQEKAKQTPLQFFTQYVEDMSHRIDTHTGRYIGERTQIHHKTVLKRIKSYMEERRAKDDFSIFNEYFEKDFSDWAYTSRGYRYNTIPATFSVLKVWLNAARKDGIFISDAYKDYKSKGIEVDNIYLTEGEIKKIFLLDIKSLKERGEIDAKSTIETTRDLFIIGCWTGLRRSDINRLDKALFDLDKELISIVTEKTAETVTIPMHPMVKSLYEKYNGKFPHLVDKSKVNLHLQELGRHADINDEILITDTKGGKKQSLKFKKYQLIKFHTARRSFATNLYLKGAPTISIMKLTGHTTEMNFLKYIKVTKAENAEMMRKFFK